MPHGAGPARGGTYHAGSMTAVHRVEVRPKPGTRDPRGERVLRQAESVGLPRPTRAEHAEDLCGAHDEPTEGEEAQEEQGGEASGHAASQASRYLLSNITNGIRPS